MAFALWAKQVHCPVCHYTGKARVRGTPAETWGRLGKMFLMSFLIWPLFLVTAAFFVWAVFHPARQTCPHCDFQNPTPAREFNKIEDYELNRLLAGQS